jgi:ATP-dependent helicase/nuclease subunit B
MFGLNDAPDDVLHGIVNDETAYDFISGRYGEKDSGSLEAAVCDYFENNCAQPHYADTLKAAAAFTNEAVLHSAKYYDKLLGKNARLSVSKLEKYAQCPFGFYTGYILKPVQRKRYQIRRLDIGIVVHAVMEAFSQKLFSAGAPAPDMREDEIAALADELTRQTLERYATGVFSELAKSRYQTAKIARVARDVIRETLRQLRLSDFRLTEAESAFANVAVEIEGAGRILLEGKIDRIDAYEANGEKYIKSSTIKRAAQKWTWR